MIIEFCLEQKLDHQGNPENFTRDTYPFLPSGIAEHLDENGLPKVGEKVQPGMLLIAKFGATKSYRRDAMPSDIERWLTAEETLIDKYKHMFYDASFYVPAGVYGRVTEAFTEQKGQFKRVVVRVEKSNQP